jgi:hypothetical protein
MKAEIAAAVGRGCTRFILDGWPTSVDQHAEFEASVTTISQVLYLQCSLESLEQRRPEDVSAAALEDKLAQWQAQGLGLVDAAAARGLVQTVDGTMADDEVEAALLALLVPRLVPFFGAATGGSLAARALALCAGAGYRTIDVAKAVGDAPDVATKVAALKRALEATTDSRYVLSGFPLVAEEAHALEALFGAPKIAVTCAVEAAEEEGGEEGDAPEAEGEEGAELEVPVAEGAVDAAVLAHYARELFSITAGAEGDFELGELRAAFQPLVWLLVAADGNVRADSVLQRAARDRGYAVLRVASLFATEVTNGSAAGRAIAAAQAQRRTVSASLAVSLISAKMKTCIGDKFIIEGSSCLRFSPCQPAYARAVPFLTVSIRCLSLSLSFSLSLSHSHSRQASPAPCRSVSRCAMTRCSSSRPRWGPCTTSCC